MVKIERADREKSPVWLAKSSKFWISKCYFALDATLPLRILESPFGNNIWNSPNNQDKLFQKLAAKLAQTIILHPVFTNAQVHL